jgi:para-nitrobenzyl esterase
MNQTFQTTRSIFRRSCLWAWLPGATLSLLGCAGAPDAAPVLTGDFAGTTVAGLDYRTTTQAGVTDGVGAFRYRAGESVSFAIGELQLGSATGAAVLTALSITPGAAAAADVAVNNKLVLLQTLDTDGDLNNGIQISPQTRAIVSAQAASIDFNVSPVEFRAKLAGLMTALNAGQVFKGGDPQPRAMQGPSAALQLFTRASSERITTVTAQGPVRGYAAGSNTWQYLGVPYAKAPVGALRWRPPVAPEAWANTRDALDWGDRCAQNPMFKAIGEGGMSEDCLYLNVTTPKSAQKLPVMVWFHGGGFVLGTANATGFNNPAGLPSKGVVVVSVNHRLGPFGYLAHPLLSAESGYGGSGNYGQMDLIASLQWVKQNISRFGGDPDNVTIFGESGGGGKVASLMNSPIAKGLFHKAIVQSGLASTSVAVFDVPAQATAEKVGAALFTRMNATTLTQARALTWSAVVGADLNGFPRGDNKDAYGPSIDGHYATRSMQESIKSGLPSDVPLIAGANSGDFPMLLTGLAEQMPMRSRHNRAPQFVYKLSKAPSGWEARGILSWHGADLIYVFNDPASALEPFKFGFLIDPATHKPLQVGDLNGNGISGSAGDMADVLTSAGYDAKDAAVTDAMMSLWTQFAKTGNPSTPTLLWPAYTADNDSYLEITATPRVKTGLVSAFK